MCTIQLLILRKQLWTRSFKRDTMTQKLLSQQKCLEERKKLRFDSQETDRVLHCLFFSTDLGHIFGRIVGNGFALLLRGKGPHKLEFVFDMSACIFSWYTQTWSSTICWSHKASVAATLSLCFKAKVWEPYNYRTELSDIQQHSTLKNYFLSIHMNLRDTRGEKLRFVSVGNTRLALMFRKASNNSFKGKTCYKMVASGQLKIPYYRGIGQQRERGLLALEQVIGRTSVSLFRKFAVPAAKRVSAASMEIAALEIAEVVSGRHSFKGAVKNVGRQTLEVR